MKKLAIILTALLFSTHSYAAVPSGVELTESQSCIGYIANKSMFFVQTHVVAKGCQPKITLEESPSKRKIRVTVEHRFLGLDSGLGKRDAHMAEIFNITPQGNIAFQSEWLDRNWLRNAQREQKITLRGKIIGGIVKAPVVFNLSLENSKSGWLLTGVASAKLDDFNIKVPEIGPFGMIATVHQDFELWVHLFLEEDEMVKSYLQ